MPVCSITGRERPPNCLNRNAVSDVDVPSYVRFIVIINEIALADLPERYEGGSRQKEGKSAEFAFS